LQIAQKQKGASKKVPKLEEKNNCDLGGDWDVVNSLRLPQLFICGFDRNFAQLSVSHLYTSAFIML